MSKNNRKISNFIIDRKFQVTNALMISGIGIGAMIVLFGFYISRLNRLFMEMVAVTQNESAVNQLVLQAMKDVSFLTFGMAIATSAIMFVTSIVLSHRVAGAARGVQNYIAEIRKGNYDSQHKLRRYDYLHNIMADLRLLAQELKRKSSNS